MAECSSLLIIGYPIFVRSKAECEASAGDATRSASGSDHGDQWCGPWRAAGDVQDEAAAIPARQARGVA
jgi:hypothetical protein